MNINIESKNYIVIAPRYYHFDLLKILRQNKVANIKIFTKDEVIKQLDGEYSYQAIIETMNSLNTNYNNAKIYIDNLNLLSDDESQKIHQLFELKEHLKEKECINYFPYTKHIFTNKDIYVIGYGKNDKELNKLFGKNLNYIDYEMGLKKPIINEFNNINDELFFVFNEIAKLIESGIKQEDIELIINSDKYYVAMNKMCEQFELPHLISGKTSYINIPNINLLLKEIALVGIDDFKLHHEFDDNEDVKKIIQIIDDYKIETIFNKTNQLDFLKAILKNISVVDKCSQFIKINESLPISNDNKYYFLLGFNQGEYPKVKKDDDYLSNDLKKRLGLSTSIDDNQVSKNKVIDFITNTEHLVITFPYDNNSEILYPSSLVKELGLKICAPQEESIYSLKEAKRNLAKLNDLYRKYNFDSDLRHSYMHLVDIPYFSYSHAFTKVKNYQYEPKRRYSYSKIKSFFQCQFQYYLTNVLKLNDYEVTFAQALGTLFHNVLRHVYDSDFDFDNTFNALVEQSDYKFVNSEKVILDKKKEDLRVLCQILLEQLKFINLKDIKHEQTFYKNLNDEVSIYGQIDKIMITTDSIHDYYVIIDYKTGSETFIKDEVKFGFSMQLPTYALLLDDNDVFKNKELIGFYIQKITIDSIGVPLDNVESFYQNHYKLMGETTNEIDKIKTFDASYASSNYIKSYGLKKDGVSFTQHAKTFSKEDFANVISLTKDNFIYADEKIKQGDFIINPKIINNSQDSVCKFCPFKDICGVEKEDYIYINTKGEDD